MCAGVHVRMHVRPPRLPRLLPNHRPIQVWDMDMAGPPPPLFQAFVGHLGPVGAMAFSPYAYRSVWYLLTLTVMMLGRCICISCLCVRHHPLVCLLLSYLELSVSTGCHPPPL